jgi:hypothetical protein
VTAHHEHVHHEAHQAHEHHVNRREAHAAAEPHDWRDMPETNV